MRTLAHTPAQAPEQVRDQRYSRASDAWAFGLVLLELYDRKVPFAELTPMGVVAELLAGECPRPPANMPPFLQAACQRLWRVHPANRTSVAKVLAAMRARWHDNGDVRDAGDSRDDLDEGAPLNARESDVNLEHELKPEPGDSIPAPRKAASLRDDRPVAAHYRTVGGQPATQHERPVAPHYRRTLPEMEKPVAAHYGVIQ